MDQNRNKPQRRVDYNESLPRVEGWNLRDKRPKKLPSDDQRSRLAASDTGKTFGDAQLLTMKMQR